MCNEYGNEETTLCLAEIFESLETESRGEKSVDIYHQDKQRMAWGQENDIKMDDGRGMRADD